MAKLVFKPKGGGGETDALLKSFQKEYGAEVVASHTKTLQAVERIPTGIMAFDLATGGGFPRGKCSIIFGPESSCKTNLAYLAIAAHQKLWPHLVCTFIDVEHEFNAGYAKKFGVDVTKLKIVQPTFAEQVVDIAEALLHAADCGLVVIDSLAAMVTANEFESSGEKAVVGGNSNPVAKLCRKTALAMGEADKFGRKPTLIYINQIRHKIGVVYGDPETMPGGNLPRFQAALWVRVYGKNILDTKVNQDLPVMKEVKFVIKKWKVPIFSAAGEFQMATIAHKGFKVGQSDDYSLIKALLEQTGEWVKGEKGGWSILGQTYKTQDEFRQLLMGDFAFANTLKNSLIYDLTLKSIEAAENEGNDG
ncbi:recombinase protein [Rhizobium phage RHph_TM16]|nr:recombinase protein [Rhizobium phage RHph_TM16]